jgi:hypothetical protein
MKLKVWLFKNKMKYADFNSKIGISKGYIHRLYSGERCPSEKLMRAIRWLTDGKVATPKDLLYQKKKAENGKENAISE